MTAKKSPTESPSDTVVQPARVVRLREDALLFSFTSDYSRAPDLALQKRVWALASWLEERRDTLSLQEIVPGMGNLLLTVCDPSVGAGPARDQNFSETAGSASPHIIPLADQILKLWPTLVGTEIRGRTIDIPVSYNAEDGPDLKEVSAHTGLSINDIIARHIAGDYRVYCLGFQPGFAYLGGLDLALATPRRATPRLAIPKGSVAIGGSQSAVYPSTTPGGWQVIGRTEMRMFDPEGKHPSTLMPGDRVRFSIAKIPPAGACLASELLPERAAGDTREQARSYSGKVTDSDRGMIEIVKCGALTTVQDLGRHGYRHLGVGQSGALDPIAVRQANLLLGNSPEAAVLEISVGPLVLRFTHDCAIALSGSGFIASIDHSNAELLPGHVSVISAGDTVTLSKPLVPGARTYLAVAGGFDVPLIMNSRSTDINARFGGLHGRPLQTGDRLPIGHYPANSFLAKKGIRPLSPSHILRALPGPEYASFTAESCENFWTQAWRINHQSNRMGLRLNGHALALLQPLELLSAGVLPGDVQVPPNGLPIVLANDAQTIGGYPRIASVIKADLWQLAHVPPGTSVYFQRVMLEEAAAAAQKQLWYLNRTMEFLQDFPE